MNKKLAIAKKFVENNKVAIAVGVTTAVCVTLHRIVIEKHNDFLTEHGLFDAFYNAE